MTMAIAKLYVEWNDAYRAFVGAFDKPSDRLTDQSPFSVDARERMKRFNERLRAIETEWRASNTPAPEYATTHPLDPRD
jgi:hypothetical protein